MPAATQGLGFVHKSHEGPTRWLGNMALAVSFGIGLLAAPIAILTATPAAAAGPVATVTAFHQWVVLRVAQQFTITGTNLGSTGTTTVEFAGGSPYGVSVVNVQGNTLTVVAPDESQCRSWRHQYGSTYKYCKQRKRIQFSPEQQGRSVHIRYDSDPVAQARIDMSSTITAQETSPIDRICGDCPGTLQAPLDATVNCGQRTRPQTGSSFGLSIVDVSTNPPIDPGSRCKLRHHRTGTNRDGHEYYGSAREFRS